MSRTGKSHTGSQKGFLGKVVHEFNEKFQELLAFYEKWVTRALVTPGRTALLILGGIVAADRGSVPIRRTGVFSADGPRAVCHQLENADRDAVGGVG